MSDNTEHMERRPGSIAIEVVGGSKQFRGITALSDVSLEVRQGEIVGLVGENGAGKSTLLDILSGVMPPDAGCVKIKGARVNLTDYYMAKHKGIFRVFQESALVPNLRVYENMSLGHEKTWGIARYSRRKIHDAVIEATSIMDIGFPIQPEVKTETLGLAETQFLEIARAFAMPHLLNCQMPIVLLDEPTTVLDQRQTAKLLKFMRQFVKNHGSILLISHRLPEILEVCDWIYVLKDGHLTGSMSVASTNEQNLHTLMVGRARMENYYEELKQVSFKTVKEPVLCVTRLQKDQRYADVSFNVAPGEIVGIGGLQGCGKEDVARGLAGVERATSGTIRVGTHGTKQRPTLRTMLRCGLAYLPADRANEGIIAELSSLANAELASLSEHREKGKRVGRRRLRRNVVDAYVKELDIRPSTLSTPCGMLSGGNQQKVLLTRLLLRQPQVLVLDNPTRGVDTGARSAIYSTIRNLTHEGVGIVLITDDLPELIGLSNRIILMQAGRIMKEVESPADQKPSEEELLRFMLPNAERDVKR